MFFLDLDCVIISTPSFVHVKLKNVYLKPLKNKNLRDWSKSTGGWAGAFENVVVRKHDSPLPFGTNEG